MKPSLEEMVEMLMSLGKMAVGDTPPHIKMLHVMRHGCEPLTPTMVTEGLEDYLLTETAASEVLLGAAVGAMIRRGGADDSKVYLTTTLQVVDAWKKRYVDLKKRYGVFPNHSTSSRVSAVYASTAVLGAFIHGPNAEAP